VTERTTSSEDETVAAGRELGSQLGAGSLVLVEGRLGAGKTVFVRGLAAGLDCAEDEVSSPTFALIQEYRGRLRLHHVDLYRLTPREVDDLPLDELLEDDVVVVEWPDRWRQAPKAAWVVRLEVGGANVRTISITPPPDDPGTYSTR
jgi:tRNA threonylcarbamoyladenosine biosynthesis protein TsaE